MKPGIYKITSKAFPKKIYIGSTTNLHRRKLEHFKRLRRNEHHSIILQRHVNKYGIDDLEFSVIQHCDIDQLIEIEQFYIDSFNPYFNVCKVAGLTIGVKQSKETKEKRGKAISECWNNKTQSEKDEINSTKRLIHRNRMQHKVGRIGFFDIEFTEDKDRTNRIIYSFKCILRDSISLRTYTDPTAYKCKCMKRKSGCDKIKSIKLPKKLKPYKFVPHKTRSPLGHKGLSIVKGSNRIRVQLKYKGVKYDAGYYDTIEQAIAGRNKYIQERMQHTDYKVDRFCQEK